jgi:hypothetical protein
MTSLSCAADFCFSANKEIGDFLACPAVAIWTMSASHSLIGEWVIEQALRLFDNSAFIGSNKLGSSGMHRLRSLGILTQHQNRFAQ